jgi:hypothetical protein
MSFGFKQLLKEQKAAGFKCLNCRMWVPFNAFMGTYNRNHCFMCLWSKHVDFNVSGDRLSDCHGGMEPLALTFKHEGYSKKGEIMVVHMCCNCNRISINRIAADDMNDSIIELFEVSKTLNRDILDELYYEQIDPLSENDRHELFSQLFGREGV